MAHAFLSPSGAPGWLVCHRKPWLEEGVPDRSSAAADEGTAAHELAANCLLNCWDPMACVGQYILVGDTHWEVTHEMAEHVSEYVNRVRALPGMKFFEERLDISWITGEAGAGGTADAMVFDEEGKTLYIADLKYGYHYVPADSPQLLIYAAAALAQFGIAFEGIERVVTQIHQPRIGSHPQHEVSVTVLDAWIKGVQETAARILAGPDGLDVVPGEKQCKFCRAKGACPALREQALTVISLDDFTDLDAKAIDRTKLLTTEQLAALMPHLELIVDWCNGVRGELERRLLLGDTASGWKVVAGKRGARAWVDEVAAAKHLEDKLGDKAYSKKLISPTQAEKLLKSGYSELQELVTQPEGKAAVVPESDKRPALETLSFQSLE